MVRFTNTDVVTQIVYAKLQGDYVLTAAYSHELPRYGIKGGLTNWAAGTFIACSSLLTYLDNGIKWFQKWKPYMVVGYFAAHGVIRISDLNWLSKHEMR